jgi:N-acetylmuramoyl-L-alanine amidase
MVREAVFLLKGLTKQAKSTLAWLLLGLAAANPGLGGERQKPVARPLVPAAAPAGGAQIEQVGSLTRLSVAVTGDGEVAAYLLADPERAIVDLPDNLFQADPQLAKSLANAAAGGLVRAVRFGLFALGKSRLVVDLAGPARIERAAIAPGEGGTRRLVIDLAASDAATFRAHVVQQQPEKPSAVVARRVEAPASAKPVIVLDPGHGGIDGGANGVDGAIEKSVVFEFAQMLRRRLESSGQYRVVMTRESDVFVALKDRVRLAREAGAQLFVSIHADTLAESGDVNGATVYTLAERASDAEAARVAEKENAADAVAGLPSEADSSDVSDILFDLTRRETRTYSHLFSRSLVNYLKAAAKLNKNPQRSAGFKVLRAPDFPSVLIELGYLSSPKDVQALQSTEWRDKTTASVALAIDNFFSPRVSGPADEGVESGNGRADSLATGSLPPTKFESALGGARLMPEPAMKLRGSVAPQTQ